MALERVRFPGAHGGDLAGRLELPADGAPRAYALFAHCFTCTKNLKAIGNISQALAAEGIAVLRFDFTGLGESEGEFADTTFSSNVADLIAAADYLAQHHMAPALLIGHSLGGAAVLQAAAQIPAVRAVATIGAPCDPVHITHLIGDHIDQIAEHGVATVTLAGRSFTITRQFLEDLDEQRMQATIRNLKRPLLVLHSPIDQTVGIENAARIFQAAFHPKSFVSLDKADHLLSNPRDSRYAGTVIAGWAARFLDLDAEEPALPPPPAGAVVVRTGAAGYTSGVQIGRHRLIADEPHSVGGADLGPAPYDFLLAGLGACTGMTLRMYADRKQWPLEGVDVQLRHAKIHAADCADCETKASKIDRIERTIMLSGPLDAEQRARLLEIADRCPVHRTLHSEISIVTRLLE
jgi:uncharacterized OsmC-like protein/alpha/beta superfamily hydrolase